MKIDTMYSGNNSVPNFSVPPPNFSNGGQGGYQQQQPQSFTPQGGNWSGSNPSSGGYQSGGHLSNDGYGSSDKYQSRGGGSGGGGGDNRNNYGSSDRRGPSGGGGGGGGYQSGNSSNFSGSGNKGGYNKGDDGDMVTQEDTIFVQGMNPQTDEDEIAKHFGAIGIIKKDKRTSKPKIWLYKDKETGQSKGEATVTYDDSNAAASAIQWFNNKTFNGAVIRVSLAQRQNNWQKGGFRGNKGGSRDGGRDGPRDGGSRDGGRDGGKSRFDSPRDGGDRRGGGGGGGAGGGGGRGREGDWTCGSCSNTNFAWRNECNRCKEPKQEGAGGAASGGSSRFGGSDGGFRGQRSDNRPAGGNFQRGNDRGPRDFGNRGGNNGAGNSFGRRDGPMRGNDRGGDRGGDRGNDRSRPY